MDPLQQLRPLPQGVAGPTSRSAQSRPGPRPVATTARSAQADRLWPHALLPEPSAVFPSPSSSGHRRGVATTPGLQQALRKVTGCRLPGIRTPPSAASAREGPPFSGPARLLSFPPRPIHSAKPAGQVGIEERAPPPTWGSDSWEPSLPEGCSVLLAEAPRHGHTRRAARHQVASSEGAGSLRTECVRPGGPAQRKEASAWGAVPVDAEEPAAPREKLAIAAFRGVGSYGAHDTSFPRMLQSVPHRSTTQTCRPSPHTPSLVLKGVTDAGAWGGGGAGCDSHPLWSSGSVPWSVHLHMPEGARLRPPDTAPGPPASRGTFRTLGASSGETYSHVVSQGCLEEVDVPVEGGEGWPGPQEKSPPAHGKQARPAGAQGHLCLPVTAAGPWL